MTYQFICKSIPVIIVKIREHISVQEKEVSIVKFIQPKRDLSIIRADLPILLITNPGTKGMSKNMLRPEVKIREHITVQDLENKFLL